MSRVVEHVKVNDNETWEVESVARLSACDNRPGLKKIYVWVMDQDGHPLAGARVRFDTHPSYGVAYDHMNVWGLTDQNGYLEWDHLGKPTRYRLWMEDGETPLVENIRTDLGNEYCRGEGWPPWAGWRPVNRPGIYSYRVRIMWREAAGAIP